jgi:hypothetical protein
MRLPGRSGRSLWTCAPFAGHVGAQAEDDGRELLVQQLPRRQLRVDAGGNLG